MCSKVKYWSSKIIHSLRSLTDICLMSECPSLRSQFYTWWYPPICLVFNTFRFWLFSIECHCYLAVDEFPMLVNGIVSTKWSVPIKKPHSTLPYCSLECVRFRMLLRCKNTTFSVHRNAFAPKKQNKKQFRSTNFIIFAARCKWTMFLSFQRQLITFKHRITSNERNENYRPKNRSRSWWLWTDLQAIQKET